MVNVPRLGRLKIIPKAIKQKLLANVRGDRNSREKLSEYLAYELNISRRSIYHILAAYGLKVIKLTRKALLILIIKKAR